MERALPADVAENTGYLLSRLGLRSRRLFAETIAQLGIRPPHFGILCMLDTHGELAQAQLAEGLQVDRGQLVGLLDELERAGYVVRGADPDDRRRHAVALTPAGRRTVKRARRLAATAEQQLVGVLTADEQDALRGLLLRLPMK